MCEDSFVREYMYIIGVGGRDEARTRDEDFLREGLCARPELGMWNHWKFCIENTSFL